MRLRKAVVPLVLALLALLTLLPSFALAGFPTSPALTPPETLVIVSDTLTEVDYYGWGPSGPAYAPCGCWPSLPGASWIWSPGGGAVNAPSFRRLFDLPLNAESISGNIRITADNQFSTGLNGTSVGIGNNWGTIYTFPISSVPGSNELSITAVNWGGPAGLLFRVEITYTLGTPPTAITLSRFGIASGRLGPFPLEAVVLVGGLTAFGGFALWRRRKPN